MRERELVINHEQRQWFCILESHDNERVEHWVSVVRVEHWVNVVCICMCLLYSCVTSMCCVCVFLCLYCLYLYVSRECSCMFVTNNECVCVCGLLYVCVTRMYELFHSHFINLIQQYFLHLTIFHTSLHSLSLLFSFSQQFIRFSTTIHTTLHSLSKSETIYNLKQESQKNFSWHHLLTTLSRVILIKLSIKNLRICAMFMVIKKMKGRQGKNSFYRKKS